MGPEIIGQHRGRENGRDRIRDILARDIGGSAMNGLEDRTALAIVRARHNAETADQAGAEIGDDIAVEIFEQ